jgi:hypothetical protein
MFIEEFGKLEVKGGCKIFKPYALTYGRMMCFRLHCILQYALYNEICRIVFELDSLNISTKLWQPELLLSSFIMGHFVCLSRRGQNDDC